MFRLQTIFTHLPYTTLFRSRHGIDVLVRRVIGRLHPRIGAVEAQLHEIAHRALDRRPQLLLVGRQRSEEHTSELQSRFDRVCRLLLEKKKMNSSPSTFT